MTDRAQTAPDEAEDLRLVVELLNEQLDPQRADEVRRRLQEEPEFLELAAPLLLAWQVPATSRRTPRPPDDIEKHWDEFTRRAGFVHQRRKARRHRNWTLAGLLLFVALVFYPLIERSYTNWRHYETITPGPDWVTLADGSQVQLAAGARMRASKAPVAIRATLRGEARFRVVPPDVPPEAAVPEMRPIRITTRAGMLGTTRGEFLVEARGDTTWVELYAPARRAYFKDTIPLETVMVLFGPAGPRDPLVVLEGERARMVRGVKPERIPSDPASTARIQP